MLGRTRREFLESIGLDEYLELMAFVAEFDLPDAFHLSAHLGPMLAALAGVKRPKAADFSPIHGVRAKRTAEGALASIRAFGQFMGALSDGNAKGRQGSRGFHDLGPGASPAGAQRLA